MKHILLIFSILLIKISLQAQYVELNTGITKKLYDLNGSTQNTLWVTGDSGTVLKSTNIGLNWINQTGNGIGSNINLTGIKVIYPDLRVIACGNSTAGSHIFLTNDSGNHWSQVFFQPGSTALAIGCQIFVGSPVGGRWSIWRSNFSGQAWDSSGFLLPHINNEQAWNNSILLTGDCDYQFYIGTNAGKIYRRIGNSWTIYSSLPENNIRTFTWLGGFGYIAGSSLYYTGNYGTSWQLINAPGSGNFVSMTQTVFGPWYVREDNKVYNFDSTNNWNLKYTAPDGNFTKLVNAFFYLFALRDNGKITRIQLPPIPVGVIQTHSQIPKSFSLSQNYPNPFNPNTIIRFKIKDSRLTILKVFDVLGREVQTLVNEQLKPGTYEVDFDGTNLPSGVYYYQLTISNEQLSLLYKETKKMVLIK